MQVDLESLLAWAQGRDPKGPYALVTLVEIDGSVPQRVGAHMVVALDGQQQGTVGGGALEYQLARMAREQLVGKQSPRLVTLDLGKDLGMACGGKARAFIEPFANRHEVIVFGCGHVSRALVPLLVSVDFDVTVVDDRSEWADPAGFPASVRVVCKGMLEHAKELGDLSNLRVLVMTRGHEFDFGLVKELLPRSPLYLGVMASASKRQAFGAMLRKLTPEGKDGDGDIMASFPNLFLPVGLPIGSRTPPEIAVSIAAQLVLHRFERAK